MFLFKSQKYTLVSPFPPLAKANLYPQIIDIVETKSFPSLAKEGLREI